ncbi:hypothetical protein T440DRAFT_162139 [Plenodomus tracheiphilus IPT5]|uniref:Uncharacterized protein n=1 Tax=Plenodomus tracheiphilus IPT5 TaxID=1408161 RepID=A0A6A7BMS6_9PLEO|nr:hypothetical protein T440DRAFT_162139 [Plenodomus tracheiphilus IPT5]
MAVTDCSGVTNRVFLPQPEPPGAARHRCQTVGASPIACDTPHRAMDTYFSHSHGPLRRPGYAYRNDFPSSLRSSRKPGSWGGGRTTETRPHSARAAEASHTGSPLHPRRMGVASDAPKGGFRGEAPVCLLHRLVLNRSLGLERACGASNAPPPRPREAFLPSTKDCQEFQNNATRFLMSQPDSETTRYSTVLEESKCRGR